MNMYNNMQVIIIDGKRIIPILSFIDKLSMSVKIRYLDILKLFFIISEPIRNYAYY